MATGDLMQQFANMFGLDPRLTQQGPQPAIPAWTGERPVLPGQIMPTMAPDGAGLPPRPGGMPGAPFGSGVGSAFQPDGGLRAIRPEMQQRIQAILQWLQQVRDGQRQRIQALREQGPGRTPRELPLPDTMPVPPAMPPMGRPMPPAMPPAASPTQVAPVPSNPFAAPTRPAAPMTPDSGFAGGQNNTGGMVKPAVMPQQPRPAPQPAWGKPRGSF